MAREEAMQEVELDPGAPGDGGPAGRGRLAGDDPAPYDPVAAEARRRRRRRALARWWPVAAVAAVALVGSQLVVDARERDRVAAARAVDGVVDHDLVPPLAVEPVGSAGADRLGPAVVSAGGLRVAGAATEPGTPRAVVAVDQDGREVWRTEVETAAHAAEHVSVEPPTCWGPEDAVRVVCLVQDRPTTPAGDDAWEIGEPSRSWLLVVDAASGAVAAERDLLPLSSAAGDGDALVVAQVDGPGVRLASTDPDTGEARWETVLTRTGLASQAQPTAPAVRVEDGRVLVQDGAATWALRAADGELEAHGAQLWVGRTGALLAGSWDEGGVRFVGTGGGGADAEVRAVGTPVWLTVDDGSAPGLELLSRVVDGGRRLSAVEPATGRVVWERVADDDTDGAVILLDGVLYGADGMTVWAVDAADGREVWRTPREPGADGVALPDLTGSWVRTLTDGRRLLLQQTEADGPLLVAWSLATGERLWAEPLPAEVGPFLQVVDGALLGGTEEPLRIGG